MKEKDVKIVFCSDSPSENDELLTLLTGEDCQFFKTDSENLLQVITQQVVDVVLIDLSEMISEKKYELISDIKQIDEEIPIICIGKQTGVQEVVSLMKSGVYDFMPLPLEREKLLNSLEKAVRLYRLTKKVFFLERQRGWKGEFFGIVGNSRQMQENFKTISTVAKSNATVLILGESGTGKELVAKAIHMLSDRSKNQFVDLNCGAIPKELLENELFGHEKGAYTGADKRYVGSFQRAHGGTLFLDEICEMDLALQVKLLRVLQERNLTRIGGNEKIEVDVRIVAATNREIKDEVDQGRFREDLYYRLNVVPVVMPPLRDRIDDIPLLARHFLEMHSSRNNKMFFDIHPEALDALLNYNWPGNVRELENVIERVVVLFNDSQLKLKYLPSQFQHLSQKKPVQSAWIQTGPKAKLSSLKELEQMAIEEALKVYEGNIPQVAKALQVGQATLYRKLQKYQIKRI